MNAQKYWIASLAAGVWIFLYGFVANVIILADYWAANASPGLMRPEGEEIMWAIIASCLMQGLALGYIFTRGYENKGIGEGLRFGVLIAWFVAAIYLLFYALQPWGTTSTLVAIATDGIMYLGAGVILALLYRAQP